jgi:8-oxo-dGTP pyrophosphatase MutT (NUDIX family)
MKAEDPASHRQVWFTPGGGAIPGESFEATLRRELREETGINAFEIGPRIWTRRHLFDWNGKVVDQSEMYFLVYADRFEPVMSDADPNELSQLLEFKWWAADAIEKSSDLFAPRRLAGLIRQLAVDGPPTEPFDVGT